MLKRLIVLSFCFALIAWLVPLSQAAEGRGSERTATVMTRNLDAGSDFGFVLQAALNPATTQQQLLVAITATFQEMVASHIAGRADGIAREIAIYHPDLVSLQEVTILRTGPYGKPANTVVVDGLQSLLKALNRHGLHYKAVAVQKNASIDLPALGATYNLITAGFTDFDAVLARTDLPTSEFRISDIDMQHFGVVLPFSVAGQTIPFLRGWISMHVKVRGREYKFVNTHLETFNSDIQAAQTNELLNGPLASDLPLIVAGDLNSDANLPTWENGPAFQILQSAGFLDVWKKLRPYTVGLTWPLFAEDPPGAASLRQRIDLVLSRGDELKPRVISRTGVVPSGNGTWPSDHTGVIAIFDLTR